MTGGQREKETKAANNLLSDNILHANRLQQRPNFKNAFLKKKKKKEMSKFQTKQLLNSVSGSRPGRLS